MRPNEMSDQHYVSRMVEDVHKAVQSLDRLLRGHNGTDGVLTRLMLVKHMTEDNTEEIEALKTYVGREVERLTNSIEMLRYPGVASQWSEAKELAKLTGVVALLSGAIELAKYLLGG